MIPIRTIVFGTDFSTHSEHAFALASALARDYMARLVIAHVREIPAVAFGEFGATPPIVEDIDDANARLFSLKPVGVEVDADYVLASGVPATELLQLAEQHHADLIVVGSHGRTGLARLLMGSVAEQVVRGAQCPVLVVKQPMGERVTTKVQVAEPVPAVV